MREERSKTDAGADTLEYQEISQEAIGAIFHAARVDVCFDSLCFSSQVIDAQEFDVPDNVKLRDIRAAQRQDSVIGRLLPFVMNGKQPKPGQLPRGTEFQQFLKEFHYLSLRRGVLYRVTHIDIQENHQLVLPQEYRYLAMKGLHNDVGHMGRNKTLDLVRGGYYWPRVATEVEEWVRKCVRCKVSKGAAAKAPLVNIVTTQPLQLVCLDYLTLEMSQGGYENILVITDHFTRFSQTIPTRNQTARTTAEMFLNQFVVHYRLPKRIQRDQGRNFESTLIKEMCTLHGLEKSRTTPYHPMGNGMTEKFNQTLIRMLRTLQGEKKFNWKAHVVPFVLAYNASRHAVRFCHPFI